MGDTQLVYQNKPVDSKYIVFQTFVLKVDILESWKLIPINLKIYCC